MYERFYNLRERPFALSPDPAYLFPSRVHTEALTHLRYGIEAQQGFIVLTGEIGSGKTTMLQTVLSGLDQQTSVSRLVSTMLGARELLEAVMLDFGLDPGTDRSMPYLLRDLARFLVDQRGAGRLALLVVDEAQNLSFAALEQIRMLSNFETEKSKLIQIALIGQPSLRAMLNRPEFEQLRQRVTVSYHLRALDAPDTAAYVNHRLRCAAIGAPLEFPHDVTDLIHRHGGGIPRKINVIADAVLLFGYAEDCKVITADLTQEVLQELEATGVIGPLPAVEGTRPMPSTMTPSTVSTTGATTEADLAAREQRLAVREQQLAEQQRILLEERRLLLSQRKASDAAPHQPEAAAPQEPRTERTSERRTITIAAPPAPPPPPKTAKSSSGVWTRVRRSLLGPLRAAFED
jgi:putative secretion ATPase (PEP-CTERM system associated)